MTDFPVLDPMKQPWLEPGVYCGPAETTTPLLTYDGGQASDVTVRCGTVAAEKRRPWHTCNDAAAIWTDPDGSVCLLAVADGVGSSEPAGRAARAAVNMAVRSFRYHWGQRPAGLAGPTDALLAQVVHDVDASLADLRNRVDPADAAGVATTLTVAGLPTRVPPGGTVYPVLARVGDSSAWRIGGGRTELLFEASAGRTGGPSAYTHALPGHHRHAEVRTVRVADGEVLALTTDGLAADARAERAMAYLGTLWAAPPTPLEFLASLGLRRNDRDDDRAAAVAWVGHREHRGL